MKLVDTSAWIETLAGTALGRRIARLMPPPESHVVPTLVQHELAKWLMRERDEETADQVIAYTMTCAVVPLDTGIALRSAELARTHRLATADAIIYATALQNGAELVTCDAHFKGLPQVAYHAKA